MKIYRNYFILLALADR